MSLHKLGVAIVAIVLLLLLAPSPAVEGPRAGTARAPGSAAVVAPRERLLRAAPGGEPLAAPAHSLAKRPLPPAPPLPPAAAGDREPAQEEAPSSGSPRHPTERVPGAEGASAGVRLEARLLPGPAGSARAGQVAERRADGLSPREAAPRHDFYVRHYYGDDGVRYDRGLLRADDGTLRDDFYAKHAYGEPSAVRFWPLEESEHDRRDVE